MKQTKAFLIVLFLLIAVLIAFRPDQRGIEINARQNPELAASLVGQAYKPAASVDDKTCSDSDGGQIYDIWGCVTGYKGSNVYQYCDECKSGSEVVEYYCFKGLPKSATYACPYGCDLGQCTIPTYCGDGIVNAPWEECDSPDLQGMTCVDFGYIGGNLSCDADCHFDISGCYNPAYCGDGIINHPSEECDTPDLGGLTCVDLGFDGGVLQCTAQCELDNSNCYMHSYCGDGEIDPPEECDSANLGGLTCANFGFGAGTLTCSPNCTFDTSGCVNATGYCGDGVINPPEQCDTNNLGGYDCTDLGFTGGTLRCNPICAFEVSNCTSQLCYDSDGPYNFEVSGYVSGDNKVSTDFCNLGFPVNRPITEVSYCTGPDCYVIDYRCSNNIVTWDRQNCYYDCINGSCSFGANYTLLQ